MPQSVSTLSQWFDQAPPHSWAYTCKMYALEVSHCFSTIALRTRQASEVNSYNVKAWHGPSSWLQLVSDGLAGRLRCRQHRPEPIELNATITVQSSIHCILGKAYVVLLASGASMPAPAALAQST